MKKNTTATTTPAAAEPTAATRNIRKSPEQRRVKIDQYLDAAIYNAKKVGDEKLAEALAKVKVVNTPTASGKKAAAA